MYSNNASVQAAGMLFQGGADGNCCVEFALLFIIVCCIFSLMCATILQPNRKTVEEESLCFYFKNANKHF